MWSELDESIKQELLLNNIAHSSLNNAFQTFIPPYYSIHCISLHLSFGIIYCFIDEQSELIWITMFLYGPYFPYAR